ncbi:unnamed protein product, partial [Strongylus vulgaris]
KTDFLAEQQRIRSTRAILAKKIKEYTAAVHSTENLLTKVDYNDFETRIELINTLRSTRIILEKTTKEQRQLEVEYNEFQKKKYASRKREKKAAKRLQDSEAAEHVEDFNEEKASSPEELFDNIIKEEPK